METIEIIKTIDEYGNHLIIIRINGEEVKIRNFEYCSIERQEIFELLKKEVLI